jgi:omega-6 fatty acid desaturase (delta-12 desaturase)
MTSSTEIQPSRASGAREPSRASGAREPSRASGAREPSRASGARQSSRTLAAREASRASGVRETGARDPGTCRTLLLLNRFARPSNARSVWQLASALAVLGVVVIAIRQLSDHPARFLLIFPWAAIMTRIFVLQHDCGHHSFFRTKRANDVVGTLISFLTGVAYEPWRTEHAWHHTHQGQLDSRGIDRVNSPMTADEATREPEKARARHRLIGIATVFFIGCYSLLVKRKALRGFFHYRHGFRWRISDPGAQARGHAISMAGHAAVHAGYIAFLGWRGWATVVLPAFVWGGGCAALLFWVQHNFERTYHAPNAEWCYYAAGAQGSSYVALPPPLAWFTAHIGLHHVHHLNSRIPNYRLEDARTAVPELAKIAPLRLRDFWRCFTHVFWDSAKGRMVPIEEIVVLGATDTGPRLAA